jgi:hypothetical protein
MRYRVLVIVPLVFVAAYLAVCFTIGTGPARPMFMRAEIETVKALALIGCWAAAMRFEKGDYLRTAWFLNGLCYLLILVRDGVFLPGFLGHSRGVDFLEGGVILAANASSVIGAWLLARAWQVAGIELPVSRVGRGTIITIAIGISLAVAGPAVYGDFRDLFAGELVSGVGLASDLGDIISFCLIAPVLLTAIALRGGSLVWPWGLITASMLGWLFYDGSLLVGRTILHADPLIVRTISDAFRSLACLFGFAAGLAQRIAVAPRTNADVSASAQGAGH